MQTKKKATTALIAAILMFSMVFAALPMASASPAITITSFTAELRKTGASTAEWATKQAYSGGYSAKLHDAGDESYAYVEIIPPSGITFNDLATITTGWSFWYYWLNEPGHYGPILELRFTGPNFDPATGAEHVDITVNTAEMDPVADTWTKEEVTSSSTATCYGNDPEGTAFTDAEDHISISPGWHTLSDIVADITVYVLGSADWELTRVQVQLGWDNVADTAYIDDIKIKGALYPLELNHGNVGDEIVVTGYDATPGGLVRVYWHEVHDWDEDEHNGLIATDYASGTSPYVWEVEFDVPETAAGTYGIIAKDVESGDMASIDFIVEPELMLDPDSGVAGDRIEVDGTGFGADVRDLDVYFDWKEPWWDPTTLTGLDADEKTEAYSINTDEFGTFTAPDRFDVPDGSDIYPVDKKSGPDKDGRFTVVGIDETGAWGSAVFTVGFYIKLDPDEGPPETMVTITGKLTEDSEVDVEFGIWTTATYPDAGAWSPGTRRTVLEDVDTDAEGYFEAEFEVPDTEPETYLVLATDVEGEVAHDWFEVLEEPWIDLSVDSGMPGDEIEVEGKYFTADSDITLTFNGIDVTPAEGIETDSDGEFVGEEFIVPDVAMGDYEVTAEDEEGLSATHDFEVREFVLIVRPRAGPYYRGATMSWEVKSTENLREIEIDIYDPTGYPFYHIEWGGLKAEEPDVVLEEDDYYYVPWYNQKELWAPLPDDAPLGRWTYEGELEYFDKSAGRWKDYDIEGTFTVVELPYETMLDKLDELGASLVSLDGRVATIETSVGTITADIDDIGLKVTAIEGDVATIETDLGVITGKITAIDGSVATIKTDLGTVKADVSAIKGYFPIEVPMPDLTPLWAAVILAAIAAIAAVAAVVQISRKLV